MNMRLRNSAVVVSLLSGIGVVTGALAADPSRFQSLPIERDAKAPAFVPRSIDSTPTKVVVFLAGDDVATVQRKVGRPLTRTEKETVISTLSADHGAMRPAIEARGGRVMGSYQSAMNGIKVEIAKNRIDSLRSIPGVVDIKPVGIYQRNNTTSVPFIGAPAVWQLPGRVQGQGVKIAIVDSGVDYTHANFGGPGTVAAFQAAKATSTAAANPAFFGPAAPKVKGGIDLVGDDYNAAAAAGSAALVPHPDANPLDCGGHGSHVAGTAAGLGVKGDGTTYRGPYTAAAYTPGAFNIGPGVAPLADLYAVRVFGCSGSTDVVADAIDWAVRNGMDVISMSLGSDFGNADNSESVAISHAIDAGVLVVAASGNAGPIPYITSAPGATAGTISVAATDATAAYPFASLTLSNGSTINVQDSNGAPITDGANLAVVVLRNANGTVSLGCNEAEYDKTRNGGIDITGKLVVTLRGTCARVYRAGAGQHYGAAAVAMINSTAGYPAYEGPIPGGDPTTNPFETVTIPFLGALASDSAKLAGPTGGPAPASAVLRNAGNLANVGFERVASFSSAGPRLGDSVLRPGVTAPGVSTVSTAVGTGNGFIAMSGTSMATPHVAGVAALVRQVNRAWSLEDQRSAVVQTASPALMKDYSPNLEGSGLVQTLAAVNTQAVVRTPDDSVSFGYADLLKDYNGTRQLTVHNESPKAVQFNVSVTKVVGPTEVTVTVPPTVVVNAKSNAVFPVSLSVPAGSVGGTHDPVTGACCQFQQVGGYITLTPSNSRLNGGASLTVPYYLVARSRSNLTTSAASLSPGAASNVALANAGGVIAATPDFYSLGLLSPQPQGVQYADTRAVGVQANPTTTAGKPDSLLVFAVNTFNRFSNAAGYMEWDISIDTTGAGTPNYVLVGYNGAAFTTAAGAQNVPVAALIRLSDGAVTALRLADAATDNSTVLLPVLASELGLTAASPRFTYTEAHFGPNGTSGEMPGQGAFNAFSPAMTVSGGGTIAPNGAGSAAVTIDSVEAGRTAPLGLMIVAADNASGAGQALVVPVRAASR